jgi:uncharacterized membrane protein YphA (DoxX/SURF4 family)
MVTSPWILSLFGVLATLLYLGLLTPYCSILCALIQFLSLLHGGHTNQFHIFIFAFNSVALSMLGPGGYSLDARILGFRPVSLSSGKRHDRSC